jgi:hypothetical protein
VLVKQGDDNDWGNSHLWCVVDSSFGVHVCFESKIVAFCDKM